MFAQEGRKLNSHVQATTGTWKFHVSTHFPRFSSSVKHSSHLFAFSRVNPVLHYTQIFCVYKTNWILIHLLTYASLPRESINCKRLGPCFINCTYQNSKRSKNVCYIQECIIRFQKG